MVRNVLRLEGLAVLLASVWAYFAYLDGGWLFFLLLILAAHVGADRFLGYGLKYSTHFRDTHVQRV